MEMLNANFTDLTNTELEKTEGGLVITIGALTITGAAIAKGAAAIGTAYIAGYTLGSHIKSAQGRK